MNAAMPEDKKATEHLANERTFLAWIRTSIAIMSLGFVVSKFGLWLRELAPAISKAPAAHGSGLSEPVGVAMIGFGGVLTLIAAWRFHMVNRQIAAGLVKVDRAMVVLITVVIAVLAVCLMAYLGLTSFSSPSSPPAPTG
jgi:putative membrane protein